MIKALFLSFMSFSAFCLSSHVESQIHIDPPEVLNFLQENNLERMVAFRNGLQAHLEKNYVLAFNNFMRAATFKGGNAEAMYIIGLCQMNGRGTARNPELGLAYIDAAAKKGFLMAAAFLVWINLEGILVPVNAKKAEEYSNMLAGRELESSFLLGTSILSFATTDEKRVMGLWLIISAAEDGYAPAQEYVKNQGTEKLLAKIVIESNLHDDLRYYNGSDKTTQDYQMAKTSFGVE